MKILAATAIVITAFAATAHADDDRRCGNVPIADWMSEADLRTKIAPLNIEVRDIDIDDGCYEVEALNRDGRKVEVSFHPQTGEQVHVEVD